MEWIQQHSLEIFLYGSAVLNIAQIIGRLTPTPKDDAAIGAIGKIFNFLFSKTNQK